MSDVSQWKTGTRAGKPRIRTTRQFHRGSCDWCKRLLGYGGNRPIYKFADEYYHAKCLIEFLLDLLDKSYESSDKLARQLEEAGLM